MGPEGLDLTWLPKGPPRLRLAPGTDQNLVRHRMREGKMFGSFSRYLDP